VLELELTRSESKQNRTRIISVGGGKGGVGKSIVAGNLAVAMAQMGKRVVLADLDLGTANQHLLLGVDTPRPGISMLLDKTVEDVRDSLTETSIENLWLLAGTGATIGAANITYNEKVKILRRLRMLDADVVVIDVGAGVGFNALDFFELGAQRLIVTTPQVTSIHDAYSFMKGVVLRTLHHHSKGREEASFLDAADKTAEGEKVIDVLAKLRKTHPEFAERVFYVLKNFGAYLVGNQVLDPKQAGIFHAVSKMMEDFLGVTVPILGWCKHSTQVHDSVNSRTPLVTNRNSDNAIALREMAETLLLEDVVMEEELLLDDEYATVELSKEDDAPSIELVLTPDALILPTIEELGVAAEAEADDDERDRDLTPMPVAPEATPATNNSNYMVGPHARVYQPPPRKKPRPKKRRTSNRRSLTLPGMVPAGQKTAIKG